MTPTALLLILWLLVSLCNLLFSKSFINSMLYADTAFSILACSLKPFLSILFTSWAFCFSFLYLTFSLRSSKSSTGLCVFLPQALHLYLCLPLSQPHLVRVIQYQLGQAKALFRYYSDDINYY